MAKLNEKELKQKIKFHEKKLDYYNDKLNNINRVEIGFGYKNKNKWTQKK